MQPGGVASSTLMLRLFRNPHPRDKRTWLPVSSPHSVVHKFQLSKNNLQEFFP